MAAVYEKAGARATDMIVTTGEMTQSRRAAAMLSVTTRQRGYREPFTGPFVCKCGSLG
jgi:hypothetical protein